MSDSPSSSPVVDGRGSKEGTPSVSKPSNMFSNALQTWTEIDLPSLQRKLDEQGLELKDDQKTSLLSRKNLAAKTKEFRKLEDKDKLEQFKSLLKLYQNEIDTLTTKKKSVENYFFGIYRLLAEAPDPRPLLELSLDSVLESSETESLRKEVERLNEELTKKADYEQLKQRLLRNEQKAAELLSSRLIAKEDEFKSLIDEKQSNWLEQEKQLKFQIKEAQQQIEELRTSKEVTELQLDTHNRQQPNSGDISSAAVLAELDIVSRDAESSKKRIFELERRNEELRRELSKSRNDIEIQSLKEENTKKVSELEGENALLVASLDQTRKKLENTSKEQSSKVESLNREISQLSQEVKNLKVNLERTNDYDELKHELQLLRQIEFGHEEDEGEGDGNDSTKTIDSILIERNKVLTQELADYRSQHDDLMARVGQLEKELDSSNQELTRLHLLNDKLENDLSEVQDVTNTGKFNDNASIISSMTRMTRPGGRNGSIVSGSLGSDEPSILPIITKQRDRFRDRNNELEEELKKQYNTVNNLKREVNSLKRDNEELYERTRYLSSFKSQQEASQSVSSRAGRKLLSPKANVSIDIESNPYQQNYESKLHPIEQFRLREQERINSKLSPVERLFISLTRAILATRGTRMLFMLYCIGLHCVVMFITIYSMSMHTSMIAEVGLNTSTGGYASGQAGSPNKVLGNVAGDVP
ncbi:CASP C terminal-domain-containing protein [Scheffersomyces xylosifermentans]|uniref:CASP C terminal-domain-containing protein n=1 Tax=Scheffersomyces xylosifermentans TaxID=1304137 RepID=UPI00315D81BF